MCWRHISVPQHGPNPTRYSHSHSQTLLHAKNCLTAANRSAATAAMASDQQVMAQTTRQPSNSASRQELHVCLVVLVRGLHRRHAVLRSLKDQVLGSHKIVLGNRQRPQHRFHHRGEAAASCSLGSQQPMQRALLSAATCTLFTSRHSHLKVDDDGAPSTR